MPKMRGCIPRRIPVPQPKPVPRPTDLVRAVVVEKPADTAIRVPVSVWLGNPCIDEESYVYVAPEVGRISRFVLFVGSIETEADTPVYAVLNHSDTVQVKLPLHVGENSIDRVLPVSRFTKLSVGFSCDYKHAQIKGVNLSFSFEVA